MDSLVAATDQMMIEDPPLNTADLTHRMDIFSAGCSLCELFTEGHPPFDFSQLLSYRSGDYNPWKVLEKIEDPQMRVNYPKDSTHIAL